MPKLELVEPNDPRRCQGKSATWSQCRFRAVEGSDYCMRHGGRHAIEKQEKEVIRIYRVAKWQAQLDEQSNNPHIKSLREEIGVLRMTLQEKLQSCQSEWDLLASAGVISELVMKIGVLVKSCHLIEKDLGALLDKSQAVQLASEMITVISNYIDDPDILNAIAEDLQGKVVKTLNAPNAA